MSLGDAELGAVRSLAKRCTALVSSPGKTGSGFFIDDDLLLTCAHVVGEIGTEVDVQPFERPPRKGEVIKRLEAIDSDVALVKVSRPPGDPNQPAVVLDRRMTDDTTYFAIGYPQNKVAQDAGQEEISYKGHPRLPGGEPSLLILDAGQASITPGLSGGPVIHAGTGAVVAIVQYRAEAASASGGGAIPVARAGVDLPEVNERLTEAPVATREWRDALGRDGWTALGRGWGWARRLDLYVEGNRREWKVTAKSTGFEPIEATYNIRNLPADLPTGLFNWAERRRIGAKADAALVGRLLAGAMLPPEVVDLFGDALQADDLLVRLHLDASNDLFDVPWEYMTIPSGKVETHLAMEDRVGFARIVRHPQPEETTINPVAGQASVLGIVMQPDGWQRQMPVLRYTEAPVEWPKPLKILADLEKDVKNASTSFAFERLENPTPNTLDEKVDEAPPDGGTREIVHYIGFGRTHEGRAEIALTGFPVVEWVPIGDLFDAVHRSGARLLVAEFVLPMSGTEDEPVRPSAFENALGQRLNAVVFTRFAGHPVQFETFNEDFYKSLGAGASIEKATQSGRRVVYKNGFWGNFAAFGSFTLITGPSSDMSLLPTGTAPGDKLVRQPAPEVGRPPVPGAIAPTKPFESFSREGGG